MFRVMKLMFNYDMYVRSCYIAARYIIISLHVWKLISNKIVIFFFCTGFPRFADSLTVEKLRYWLPKETYDYKNFGRQLFITILWRLLTVRNPSAVTARRNIAAGDLLPEIHRFFLKINWQACSPIKILLASYNPPEIFFIGGCFFFCAHISNFIGQKTKINNVLIYTHKFNSS